MKRRETKLDSEYMRELDRRALKLIYEEQYRPEEAYQKARASMDEKRRLENKQTKE